MCFTRIQIVFSPVMEQLAWGSWAGPSQAQLTVRMKSFRHRSPRQNRCKEARLVQLKLVFPGFTLWAVARRDGVQRKQKHH